MSSNSYSAAEVTDLGSAQDLIRGSTKGIFFDDGPGQERRTLILEDMD